MKPEEQMNTTTAESPHPPGGGEGEGPGGPADGGASVEGAGRGEPGSAPDGDAEQPEAPQAPDAGVAAEPGAGDDLSPQALRARLDTLAQALESQKDETLRAQAEVDNLRKRSAREVENAHKYGLERIMNELLPVRDSLELGLAAAGDEGVDVASVREGLELTLKMLNTATEKFGLAEVDPGGEAFNPELHQAISIQEVEGAESGTVINVVQKGYTLNDRLVRPAMVIVAK